MHKVVGLSRQQQEQMEDLKLDIINDSELRSAAGAGTRRGAEIEYRLSNTSSWNTTSSQMSEAARGSLEGHSTIKSEHVFEWLGIQEQGRRCSESAPADSSSGYDAEDKGDIDAMSKTEEQKAERSERSGTSVPPHTLSLAKDVLLEFSSILGAGDDKESISATSSSMLNECNPCAPLMRAETPPTIRSSVFQLFAPPLQGPVSPFARAELRGLDDVEDSSTLGGSPWHDFKESHCCGSPVSPGGRSEGRYASLVVLDGTVCKENMPDTASGSQYGGQKKDSQNYVTTKTDPAHNSIAHPSATRLVHIPKNRGDSKFRFTYRVIAQARRSVKRMRRSYQRLQQQGDNKSESVHNESPNEPSGLPLSRVGENRTYVELSVKCDARGLGPDTIVEYIGSGEEQSLRSQDEYVIVQLDVEEAAVATLAQANAMADMEISWLKELKTMNDREMQMRLGKIFELQQKKRWLDIRLEMMKAPKEARATWLLLQSCPDGIGLMSLAMAGTDGLILGFRGISRHPFTVGVVLVTVLCIMFHVAVLWQFGGWQF